MLPDTLVINQIGQGGTDLLPLWTAIVAGIIAIAAGWVASSVAVKGAREQLRASTVATTRIRWADELRNEISQLSAACLAACSDMKDGSKAKEVAERLDEANLHVMRAELLLDATSADAAALQSELDSLTERVNDLLRDGVQDSSLDDMDAQLKKVISAARKVIGSEWASARDAI